MDLLLLTQYFDVIRDVGRTKDPNHGVSIFLPHGPQAVTQLRNDLRNSFSPSTKKTG